MITPAYSPTATERVLPRLALDFTTGALDPRVTVARALNTATRVNSSGYIEGVNADLPRFDYDPITLAPKGLLIEEARTNSIAPSADFAGAFWDRSGTATVTTDQVSSPDNTQTADLFRCGATAASEVRRVGLSLAAGSHTFSVFAEKEASNFVVLQFFDATTTSFQRVWFDLNAGTVGTSASGGTNIALSSTKIEAYANGFYRCTITVVFTASTTTGRTGIFVSNADGLLNGNASSGIYLWGAQLETGAFATSYIPTTTTSLTRNADAVSMTGTNFSDWYNATESSVVVQYGGQSSFGRAFTFSDGTTANQIWIEPTYTVRASAATQYTTAIPGISYPAKVSLVFKQNRFAAVANGGTVVSGTSGNIPVVDRLYIGSNATGAGSFVNNTIAKFMYYPQALLNAEARAFSK